MSDGSTVTTRRVIKPGSAAAKAATAAVDEGQNPWLVWRLRYQHADRVATPAGAAQERALWAGLTTRPDPELSRLIQVRLLQPWQMLTETFPQASAAGKLAEPVRQEYATYLKLRVDYYLAVMRRCLISSPVTIANLATLERNLDAFVASRRLTG